MVTNETTQKKKYDNKLIERKQFYNTCLKALIKREHISLGRCFFIFTFDKNRQKSHARSPPQPFSTRVYSKKIKKILLSVQALNTQCRYNRVYQKRKRK